MTSSLRWLGVGLLMVATSCTLISPRRDATSQEVATFSIVALDKTTGEIGIAVASRIPAVGAIVPWVEAGNGAIATQALANVDYGPSGLGLLRDGSVSPEEVLHQLTAQDPKKSRRQVGVVSADGQSATYTGENCHQWAGGQHGDGYAIQGNLLTGPEVLDAMERAFLTASQQTLPDRLLATLLAGEQAGGDRRGKQSAALLVHRDRWGYAGGNSRFRDLRVDDHLEPVKELKRLLEIHRGIFPRPTSAQRDAISP